MPKLTRTIVHHSANLDIEIAPHFVAGRGDTGRVSWVVVYRNPLRPRVAYGVARSETGARAFADLAAETWEQRAGATVRA